MPVLNDDKKHANPRAASVRIAADTMPGYSGQRRHDLRVGKPPKYVDEKRVHLNRVLITPPTPAEMREIAKARRDQRDTQRAMKSNAAVATAGIITFGSEAAQMFEALSQEDQDRAFRDLAEAVADHLNTSLHALVVHLDEATIHAHFALSAYDHDGVPLSRTTRPAILSELQDLTADVMQRYCPEIERGTRYGDRLAAGEEWSEVIHKSVKQLHRELPADLAAKRAELEALEQVGAEAQDRIDGLQTEVAKLDQTATRVSGEVAQLEDERTRVEEELDDLHRDQEAAEVARDASDRIAKIALRERKERQARAAAARAETRKVESRLAGLKAAEAEARNRLADLEREEEAARKRVAEMQDRVDKLSGKATLKEIEVKRLETYRRRLGDRMAVLEAARDAAEAARDAATAETEKARTDAARVTAEAELKTEEAASEVRDAEARKAELGQEIEDLTVDAVAMAGVVADRKVEAVRLNAEAEEKVRARDAAEAGRVAAIDAANTAAEMTRTEAARAAETRDRIGVVTEGLGALVREIAEGTIHKDSEGRIRSNEPDRLDAACPEILPAIELGVTVVEKVRSVHRDARVVRDATMRERKALETDQAALRQGQDQLAEDQKRLEQDQHAAEAQATRAQWMLNRLEPLLSRFVKWLKLPGMPKFIRDEGLALLGETADTIAELEEGRPEI
jgi:chromosome segregation ATPase